MFSIEKQVDIVGSRQVVARCEHSARMTLAERGGRAIMRVLSKDARIVSVAAVAAGSDVDVSGKVICSAVCEIAGGEIVCLEYLGNFAFTHKAAFVTPPACCDVAAVISAVRVLRASGCEVVCEVDFAVRENFAVQASQAAVISAGDCYSEVEKIKSQSGVLKVHNFTGVAEMEIPCGVALVLSQQFGVELTGVSARGGSCVCTGNIHGWVSFTDLAGVVKNQPCTFPFREEFSCADAEEFAAFARVCEHNVVCEVNEVRGISIVTCEVEVEVSLWGYSYALFERGSNFFSSKVEITPEIAQFQTTDVTGCVQSTGKFSATKEWQYDLPSGVVVVSARVASVVRRGETCIFDCGICCTVCGSDMKFQEFVLDAEIAFPAAGDGKTAVCDVAICEIQAGIMGGKVEVGGRICGNMLLFADRCESVVSSLACGAEKPDSSGGFVLYRAENGETLLDVAAAVGVMPDVLKQQNPSVKFPIAGEAKVVVWR